VQLNYRVLNVVGGRASDKNKYNKSKNSAKIKLSELFKHLTSIVKTEGFEHYDVTRTTLEQVFIEFAKFQHNPEAEDQDQDKEKEQE
jgi:hypothetical protein